jgi:hypothetical protein
VFVPADAVGAVGIPVNAVEKKDGEIHAEPDQT